jgi:alkylation response protein AidB-like acyl-CoA dehydrogenase
VHNILRHVTAIKGGSVTDDLTPSPVITEFKEFLKSAMPDFRSKWGNENTFESRLAWQRILNDAQWAAPAWPTEFGGRGLGIEDCVRYDEEVASVDAPILAGTLGINNVGPTIMAWGTDDQKALLGPLLSGDHVWCQGFSEPDAGSDLASLRMRADLIDGTFVINGQKVWTSDGIEATHCMLLVRTDASAPKHAGVSVLLLTLDRPGIERRPLRQMTGRTGFAEMFFNDVRVDSSALLGPINEGWRVARTTLGYERAGVISQAARLERDVIRAISTVSSEFVDPVLQDSLASIYVESRILSALGERILADAVDGAEPGAAQTVIKLAWSQAMQKLGEVQFDLLGARGLFADGSSEPVERFLRSRASTIAAGTTEILRDVVAERVLGLPRA